MARLTPALAALVLLLGVSPAQADTFVMEAQADIDGDGANESIKLELTADDGYKLIIDGSSVLGSLDSGAPDGFKVVDIRTTDAVKEVAVHAPGPSSDDEYRLYWLKGTAIKEVGHLARWPEFPGNGSVYVDRWEGFWRERDRWTLVPATHKLVKVPQEFHSVDQECTAKEAFPLAWKRSAPGVVAEVVAAGTKARVVLAAAPERRGCGKEGGPFFCRWYLLRSETGILGWARLKDFYEKVDGLLWAD